ncbi:MAG TPA: DUF6597 domain-containing transcriptional factor [Candidatus Polarisedimenticolaceae bacterium]|nr:DUF6597 domain-containing transcriptional factor [Candidatus Polarisedimenticolaceae bacterium]
MLLHLHRPGPPLDGFVELVTYFRDFCPSHTKEKLLPDGAVEIIVDLTDRPKKMFDRDDLSRGRAFERAWISGMRREWIVIEAQRGAAMVVIRFRPGGALPFLGFAVESITGAVEPLDDVLGVVTASLRDRLLEARTTAGKMAAVEGWLLDRAAGRLERNPVVEFLADRLFAPAGIRISNLVAEIGYSQRHVLALFRKWVGLTPKQYGRIRRFQQVLADVSHGANGPDAMAAYPSPLTRLTEPEWVDLALRHGYYDQAHLIRDFNEFAGLSPGAYVAAYRGLENYLPLD